MVESFKSCTNVFSVVEKCMENEERKLSCYFGNGCKLKCCRVLLLFYWQ